MSEAFHVVCAKCDRVNRIPARGPRVTRIVATAPALFLFNDGQVAARHSGVMDLTSLRRWVEQLT